MICRECPRRCGAQRNKAAGGDCASPADMLIARAELHFWEEPAISGTQGSGAIFFTGCPLKCAYCQNMQISRGGRGFLVTPAGLADIIKSLEGRGAHNINLVTPSHYIHAIIPALRLHKPKIPVIYNCSGYESLNAIAALDGLIDVYLPDFKYSDGELARDLSGAEDYFEVTSRAVKAMHAQTGGAVFDGDGMIKSGTVIRHLILPGHIKNTLGVLRWIKSEMPDVLISVMSQYIPIAEIKEHAELSRHVTRAELKRVTAYMQKLGLDNGWTQDIESADSRYVPEFYDENPILNTP